MKRIKYVILACLSIFVVACGDLSDPGGEVELGEGMSFSDDSPAGQRIRKAIDDYGIFFKYQFPESEYSYAWNTIISSMPYTRATHEESIIKAIDYIDDEVFSLFPEGFIKKYMPPTILLVDSLKVRCQHEDQLVGETETVYHSIPGNITESALVIANINEKFNKPGEEYTATLKEDLVSLIVERLLSNAATPFPDDFIRVTTDFFDLKMSVITPALLIPFVKPMHNPYWDGDPNASMLYDRWSVEVGAAIPQTSWWGRGLVKTGRRGELSWQLNAGTGLVYQGISRPTQAQDFGDFVAFILTKTAAEKEAFYATVAAQPDRSGTTAYPGAFPYGGAESLGIIKQKVQMAKDYFQTNLGVTLQEPN
jgi:hypothetical protein